jgi:hypothetical protein
MRVQKIEVGANCYWRFKGDKAYRYGYPSEIGNGLIRMGLHNGDVSNGPIVDPKEVEVRDAKN